MMTWMTINGVCYNLAFSVISSRVSLSMRDSDKVLKQILDCRLSALRQQRRCSMTDTDTLGNMKKAQQG